jgi:hypothetical protein
MFSYLKYGLAFSALSLALTGYADESTFDCNPSLTACGLQFTTIPATPSLSSGDPTTSSPYVITNVGGVSVPLSSVTLITLADDIAGGNAVSLAHDTTCTSSTVLAPADTCNIVLDYDPTSGGLLDWNLTVTPNSTQRPLVLNISTTVSGSVTTGPAIAAGFYGTGSLPYSDTYPLLAMSSDSGAGWTYGLTSSSTLPADFDAASVFHFTGVMQPGFNLSDCFSAGSSYTCLAAGIYYTTAIDLKTYPMLAVNTGSGWSYAIQDSNAPSDLGQNALTLQGLNCYGSQCILTGYYTDVTFNRNAIAYGSTDGGVTWTRVIDSSNTGTYGATAFGQAVCTAADTSTCLTVIGTGSNAGTVLATTDGGSTWSTAYTVATPNEGAQLNFMSCSDSLTCIAADYSGQTVISTADGGVTWNQANLSDGSGLPSDAIQVYLQAVGCSASGTCIISGSYNDVDNNYYTWASTGSSADGFSTWTVQVDSSSVQPANYDPPSGGSVNGATCTDANTLVNCLVTGYYFDASRTTFPFILETNNYSTSYRLDNSSTLPTGFANGQLGQVSCNGIWCTSSGAYTGTDGYQYPWIASSYDGGTSTWNFVVQKDQNEVSSLGQIGALSSNQNVKTFRKKSAK